MAERFQIVTTNDKARRGRLTLSRATVETPAFMPVGTLASVKTLLPEQVAQLGFRLILANTYHLHLRPGEETVAALGGVQQFMGWDGALLTDSGGYQVFSLADLRTLDEDGVVFETPTGPERLTPESAMAIQRRLGSDIAMVLDECPPINASPTDQRRAMDRTHRWARRCLAAPARPDQLRFPIVQGGRSPEWRRESARALRDLTADGYGIGGLSLGESKQETVDLTAAVTEELPTDRPRYLMGVGAPEDLLEGVGQGVDLFDSVLPTRLGRHGAVFTGIGRLNLRGRTIADQAGPIDEDCDCPTCQSYSRGWLRHLITSGEPLGLRLATIHNLRYLGLLMERIRFALESGTFAAFQRSALDRLRRGSLR